MQKIVVFLPLGGSLEDQKKYGQFSRFRDYYLRTYSRIFSPVFLITYSNDKDNLPGVTILPNYRKFNRAVWQLLIPFIFRKQLRKAIMRVMQLDGILPALICKWLWGGKLIVTYGFDYLRFSLLQRKYFQSAMYWLYESLLLTFSDKIIVPNKQLCHRLKTKPRLKSKVEYLPNGVDTRLFSPKYKPKGIGLEILSVGRLETQKNYEYLIREISYLSNSNDVRLVLIGKGRLHNHLIKFARQRDVNLEIIDHVPNDQLPNYYRSCDIYVQPSLTEGSPKALLEAMSCSCCVIASDVAGNRDFVTDAVNGRLFSLGDGAMVSILKELIANASLRKKLSSGARKTALASYDLHKILERETSLIVQA